MFVTDLHQPPTPDSAISSPGQRENRDEPLELPDLPQLRTHLEELDKGLARVRSLTQHLQRRRELPPQPEDEADGPGRFSPHPGGSLFRQRSGLR